MTPPRGTSAASAAMPDSLAAIARTTPTNPAMSRLVDLKELEVSLPILSVCLLLGFTEAGSLSRALLLIKCDSIVLSTSEPLSRSLEYETCGGPPWTRTTYLRVIRAPRTVRKRPSMTAPDSFQWRSVCRCPAPSAERRPKCSQNCSQTRSAPSIHQALRARQVVRAFDRMREAKLPFLASRQGDTRV